MRPRWKKLILFAPLAILGILLVGFIGGEIVKQLWNWLMPPIFGWREITFWQAFGLLALCRILFGGHGMGRSRSWQRKSEDRERFRQAMRGRCGFGLSTSERKGSEAADVTSPAS